MRFGTFVLYALIVSSAVPAVALTHTRRGPTSQKQLKHTAVKPKLLGQRSIDDERAAQIQAALIKSGYLTDGQASGHWDAVTENAMTKLQADNGWQTKLVPDSRALIKIGLGPNNESSAVGSSSVVAGTSSVALAQ